MFDVWKKRVCLHSKYTHTYTVVYPHNSEVQAKEEKAYKTHYP